MAGTRRWPVRTQAGEVTRRRARVLAINSLISLIKIPLPGAEATVRSMLRALFGIARASADLCFLSRYWSKQWLSRLDRNATGLSPTPRLSTAIANCRSSSLVSISSSDYNLFNDRNYFAAHVASLCNDNLRRKRLKIFRTPFGCNSCSSIRSSSCARGVPFFFTSNYAFDENERFVKKKGRNQLKRDGRKRKKERERVRERWKEGSEEARHGSATETMMIITELMREQ